MVTLVLALVTVAGTWPHARDFSTTVLGGGDVLMGVRELWALEEQGGNPFTTARDAYLAAPEGTPGLRAANVANVLFVGSLWVLGKMFGWIVAFNAYNMLAFVLSGTAAFALLDRLKFGVLPAAFGAYVFAFNPNHIEKAFGHAPLAATWILPLLLLALLRKRASPTVGRSLTVGGLLVVAFYLNSYLGLFALWMTFVFGVVEFAIRPASSTVYEVVRSYYFVSVLWVLAMTPIAVSWYSDRTAVAAFSSDRRGVLSGGSASAQLYLLPGPRNPWLGDPMSRWLETNLSWEFTMFFGYTTIALALGGLVLAYVKRRRRTLSREAAALIIFSLALTLSSLWASLPPKVRIGGLELPTLGYFLREVTTIYRVYSRFGVLVGLGLVILAAYALANLRPRRLAQAVSAVALVAVALELYVGPAAVVRIQDVRAPANVAELAGLGSGRPEIVSVEEPPSYLRFLKERPPGIVADYPNPANPDWRWAWQDVFYQYFHGHPLWQAMWSGDGEVSPVRDFAADLNKRVVPSVLAGAQVRYVVVHRDRYRVLEERQPSPRCGMKKIGSFPKENVDIYRVTARGDEGFAARGRGFYSIANDKVWPEDRGFRWMGDRSDILVFSPRDDEIFLSGLAVSLGRSRRLDVIDVSGGSVGSWEILEAETSFRVPLRVKSGMNRFTLRVTPGAEPRSSWDTRKVTLAVSPLSTAPINPPSRGASADNATSVTCRTR